MTFFLGCLYASSNSLFLSFRQTINVHASLFVPLPHLTSGKLLLKSHATSAHQIPAQSQHYFNKYRLPFRVAYYFCYCCCLTLQFSAVSRREKNPNISTQLSKYNYYVLLYGYMINTQRNRNHGPSNQISLDQLQSKIKIYQSQLIAMIINNDYGWINSSGKCRTQQKLQTMRTRI